jgi:hypothetical protein
METHILRQIRLLKLYAASMTLAFAALCFTALTSSPTNQKFGEIDVQRINIVDNHGKPQLVISNKDRFPQPIVDGHELPRSTKPAGLVFYDEKGAETGGFVTSETKTSRVSLMAFDYGTGEVLDFGIEAANGEACTTQLRMVDPPPRGTKLEEAPSKQQTRMTLQNQNKDASITLADANGKDRIKLGVTQSGDAKIQIFDAHGKVLFSAPQ